MQFGKVIGSLWATIKDEHLEGRRLMLLEPSDFNGTNKKSPIIAVDAIGAGIGENVIYVTSSEAVIPLLNDHIKMAPVDATIVGIVDQVDMDKKF